MSLVGALDHIVEYIALCLSFEKNYTSGISELRKVTMVNERADRVNFRDRRIRIL